MPEETIATFTVRSLRILDERGKADEALMPPLSEADIRQMYELLVLTRTYDERALALQREGRIGTYPPVKGQEAVQVGSACALFPTDWVVPSFREMGVHFTLGYPLDLMFRYWAGDERGLVTPANLNILPICVSVGTHIPHAVGIAMAAKYRRDPVAVVAYFGDGATSKGDFHEGFNMAGVFQLPVVFICQNNQWAISIPLKGQTASRTLAQKAIAYGFDGVQVDGNDVFAVYRATKDAVEKARSGGGPTFIECLTYRVADHTTSDDASRYRSPEEVAAWREKDPILRLERYMSGRGLWDEGYGAEVKRKATRAVDEAVKAMESAAPPEPGEMFEHVSATLGQRQEKQRFVDHPPAPS
ncbi:MAG: pyruvate dehydrogenase (acetyl-transferring) E1 component subunit alpha [Geobacter sp.]|nr:pyruvate dehydrogenase (acetyl-transferring) E1 component subunit alpha [Geobacter sp.]